MHMRDRLAKSIARAFFLSLCILLFSVSVRAADPVHEWSQRFGDTSPDVGMEVAVGGSGNVIVTGTFSNTADFGGGPLVSAGGYDIFVAKYDASGTHQWSQRFGGTSWDQGYGVAADASGNVIVTGYFYNTVDFGGGDLVSAGVRDIFVAKFNASGTHQWSQGFGGTGNDYGFGVAADASGNTIVTGAFSNIVDFGGGDLVSAGDYDIFVAKYSDPPPPACAVVPSSIDFGTVFTGSSKDSSFTITNNGGGTLSGTVSEPCPHYSIVSGGGAYSLGAGQSVVVTVRFAPTVAGTRNCTIETGSGVCGDVACTGMGDEPIPVAVQAYQSHWADDHVEVTWSLIDMGVGPSFDVFRKMDADADYNRIQNPGIIQRGNDFVFEDRSTEPGRTYHYQVAVLEEGRLVASFETSLVTPSLEFALNQNHPNPFNPSTTISFTLREGARANLSIYDLNGKLITTLVDEVMGEGFKEVTWDGRDARGNLVSSGVYFYRLDAGKKVLTKKMVLLK